MDVVLYSTGCPQCMVLETLLKNRGVSYSKVTDQQTMLDKGFVHVPMLEVDGTVMSFPESMAWARELEVGA